jgi:hypothetical protein
MSTAKQFAWLDGVSTAGMCLAALGRLCRAPGVRASVLAVTYLTFPGMIVGSNLASYPLLLTLLAVLTLGLVVYALAKRTPFTERVLIIGGGRFAGELAERIETRPALALRVVGFLTPVSGPWRRLGWATTGTWVPSCDGCVSTGSWWRRPTGAATGHREVRPHGQASGMSDKPLLQSGSSDLRVGRRSLPGERPRSRARVKCQVTAFGMPLALRCPVRRKNTR